MVDAMRKALFISNIDQFHKQFHIPYIQRLQDNGYEVTIVSKGDAIFANSIKKVNIEFGRNPFDFCNFRNFLKLRKVYNDFYDLIYISTPVVGFWARISLIGKRRGRVVYSAHGYNFYISNGKIHNKIFALVEKYLCYLTDCTFTMNADDYNACKLLNFPCKEVYNVNGVGVDISKFGRADSILKDKLKQKNGFNIDTFIMLYPAELSVRKNQIILFDIVKRLITRNFKVILLLAGKGDLEDKYADVISKSKLEKSVYLLGYRSDIADLMHMSDIVVASSKNEGLPIGIIEALASGLPVVATNVRGHKDLITHGQNGFLFEEDCIDSAVNNISNLILDKHLYLEMSSAAYQSSLRYDVNSVINEYDKVFNLNK